MVSEIEIADRFTSTTEQAYSPVRHLASAAFPFSDTHKFMYMLTGYFDETEHFKAGQRFVGMAGLIATAENWETFEQKWKVALAQFKIPFFHMKHFANFRGHYEGWSELKRRKLLDRLLTIIDTTYGLPIGSIIPMDAYKQIPLGSQAKFKDPYFFAFVDCLVGAGLLMRRLAPEEKLAVVFSEQEEFRNHALRLYDEAKSVYAVALRVTTPVFRDMRQLVPLQAADLVAYELYKEAERRLYRAESDPRHGFVRLMRTSERSANFTPIRFHDKDSLERIVAIAEDEHSSF